MAKILVYNNDANRMIVFYRELSQAMPYNTNRTLTVREFRGSSNSNVLWTSLRCMQAWNSFRYLYGRGIYIGYAFKRPWEGGHGILSQHYAGLAFDAGQNLSANGRQNLWNVARQSGIWNYVEPIVDTPRWVHFDERQVASGYPLTRRGSKGVYVCILQDCLINLGYNTGGLDGVFGTNTQNAVLNYQRTRGLTVDGLVGNNTWRTLMTEVVATGSNSNTVN